MTPPAESLFIGIIGNDSGSLSCHAEADTPAQWVYTQTFALDEIPFSDF